MDTVGRIVDLGDNRKREPSWGAQGLASSITPAAGLQDENARLRAALNFILGDNSQLHPLFGGTPNLRDIAFNAFMRAKEKNDEDGGPTDWFNDTVPLVEKGIKLLRTKFNLD